MKFTKVQKKRLYSIISGAICFAAGGICTLAGAGLAGDLLFILGGVCAGIMCVVRAVKGITKGDFFDENTLMTIAAVGAMLLGEYPECAAVMILYQVGELFQSVAVGRSRKAISELSSLCPDSAEVLQNGSYIQVPATELKAGDTIRLKAGDRIAADCRIISGETSVDTSPVTGESMPRDAAIGDELFSGCINKSGLVEATVLRPASDSAAGRIMKLTETAGERKTRSEAFITRFAKVYTPAVTLIAAALAFLVPLVLMLLGKASYGEAFVDWSRRALSMLVVSCPCALVISVPLGYFCGLGNASKNGILIKGSTFIDAAASAKIAVFDKTGTLTTGKLAVDRVEACEGHDSAEILSLAAAAEAHSSHPIAKAICSAAEAQASGTLPEVKEVRETSGTGVCAVLSDGRTITAGRPSSHVAGTAVEVCIDSVKAGTIYLTDTIKPTAAKALESLKNQGIGKTVILTGDNRDAAQRVGEQVGADVVLSELMPEDKYDNIEKLCHENKVMYVGDGINDSPALARADVGVAIGVLGSDAAVESADIVLMDSDLTRLAYMMALSKRTVNVVKSNIALSLTVKLAVLILVAVNLVGMWGAVVADVGMCIVAVSNSMRLLKNKKH